MSYNSKNEKAVADITSYTSRLNLSEGICQTSCESRNNWGSCEQTSYFREAFFQVPTLK